MRIGDSSRILTTMSVSSLIAPSTRSGAAPAPRVAPLADPGELPPWDRHQLPWPGREITSGGVTLHVRETPGPAGATPAVYVHGLSGSATNWTDLAGLLGTRAAGTAVDLPGFGLTEPLPSRDFSPSGHADALLCFLAGQGRPVHLLGNSLGGAVALMVAARRPELVRSLTLVSPAMPDRRPDPRRVSDPRLVLAMVPGSLGAKARAEMAAVTYRQRAENVVRLCFGDPSRVPEHRLAEAAAEFEAIVERAPTNDYALFCLGRSLQLLGRHHEARKPLALACCLRPERSDYRRYLDRSRDRAA